MKRRLFLILGASLPLFLSCSKEDNIENTKVNSTSVVSQGTLSSTTTQENIIHTGTTSSTISATTENNTLTNTTTEIGTNTITTNSSTTTTTENTTSSIATTESNNHTTQEGTDTNSSTKENTNTPENTLTDPVVGTHIEVETTNPKPKENTPPHTEGSQTSSAGTTNNNTTTETPSTPKAEAPKENPYANKTVWVYGVSGPSFKEHPEEWVISGSSERLPWKEEYGWYDCNKIATGGTEYRDENLCWAASASNMLHWWMTQNKQYIDRYMKLTDTPEAKKSYPYTYPKRQTLSKTNPQGRSDVFAFFTELWYDKGGYTNDGINWFISGWKPKGRGIITQTGLKKGGFFSDIFPATNEYNGSSKSIAYVESGISKKRLDHILKDAFKNKKAIGFSHPKHAMTIWGAEFDENGEVSYIYYSNNNYGQTDENLNGGAVIRAKIVTKDKYYVGYVVNKNYLDKPILITKLVLLPLHQEKWEAFLNNK